jgi:CheY-like chemotaxis protein
MIMQSPEVLVIDDDQDLNARLCDILAQAGYRASSANSAEDGLRRLRHSFPGLILLDINMPGMGGLGFLRQIKSVPGGGHIPIVVLTARSAMVSFFDGMPVGGFLAKPCNTQDLLGQVERLLPVQPDPPATESEVDKGTDTILLGENDPDVAQELCRKFRTAGYRTVPAVTLTELYDASSRKSPHAIIMRHRLHALPDEEVVPMLRNLPATRESPILTYYAARHNTAEVSCGLVFTPGIRAFLEIPNATSLLQAVEAAVTRSGGAR